MSILEVNIIKTREEKFKLNPYELCPCGSESKYRFCCYLRRNEKTENPNFNGYTDKRVQALINQIWLESDFEVCYAVDEDCDEKIIKAHTLQSNGVLNRISEEGHVYTIMGEQSNKSSEPQFKLTSKNIASTFRGFCRHHDTNIFKAIDLKKFSNTEEQIFLYNFRGFCNEYHRKIRQFKVIQEFFKMAPSRTKYPDQIRMYRVANIDKEFYEKMFQKMNYDRVTKNYTSMKTFYLKLDFEVNFAVSSAFSMEEDLKGQIINDLEEFRMDDLPLVFLNIIPQENHTHITLSCRNEHVSVYENVFKQLEEASKNEILRFLNYIVINYNENVFFKISWIDNLADAKKQSILKSFKVSLVKPNLIDYINRVKYFDFDLFST